MKLTWQHLDLQLRHTFTIAKHSRTSTPATLVRLEYDGFVGHGEAAMPPYLGESHATVQAFLELVSAQRLDPFQIGKSMAYLDGLAPKNTAAKAAIDIALHDLFGLIAQKPLYEIFGADPARMPQTSFTLGIDTPDVMQQKATEATEFAIIKIKLGSSDDEGIIRAVREITDKPLFVDANRGWGGREATLDLIYWLQEQGVQLIEQPFETDRLRDTTWLAERSPLPLFADESFQRLSDMATIAHCFNGVNIKLMKCTGLYEARQIISDARPRGMQIMIGCMTETSTANLAAAALAPLCDFADLDGPFLLSNNPFEIPILRDGKIILQNRPGLGLGRLAIE